MRAYERFLQYIHIDTASDAGKDCCPSTEGQRAFGVSLVEELRSLGASDARIDENGYVTASIPATVENAPAIGLIAHLDTVRDVPCMPMHEKIVDDYDGGDILLDNGDAISPAQFPSLAKYKGKRMIVSDGNTLLGADDKAGVAEIMTLVERIARDPSAKHGKISIGFTPDEEIGRGADLFDVKRFGADFAYTVDGGEVGGLNCENFNAASGTIVVHGVNIHPGSAKDKMKNAALIAAEFVSLLPAAETPAHTAGYEGFFHLTSIQGAEEEARLHYIIRDHDMAKFAARKRLFEKTCAFLNEKYGDGTVEATVTDSYFNMKEALSPYMHILTRAEEAFRRVGVEPWREPIRGGTDGARLTFMGLPCPNLSTGGMNAHGRKECVCIEEMDKMVDMLAELVKEN